MNKLACIYFEGNDCKAALFEKENHKLKMIKAESMDMSLAFSEQKTIAGSGNGNAVKIPALQGVEYYSDENTGYNKNFLQKLSDFFKGEDLGKCSFIPILTEPALYFQKINDNADLVSLNVSAKGKIETNIDFVELFDGTKLAIYPSGQSNYLQILDSLAHLNNRRFLKIPSVKNAEISLAAFISRKYNFESNEITLILYVGKEYTKLIFLKGDKLSTIGSKVVVGKNSFNAHNVIISKILLEMEHDSIDNLDNIVVCGEDDSEDLKKTLNHAFPITKTITVEIDIEVTNPDPFTPLPGFSVPIAAAEEYLIETGKKLKGINLVPNYIREEQKIFNVGWQGYLLLFLITLSLYFFTSTAISNVKESGRMGNEIKNLQIIQTQNREAAEKMKSYENKLQNVDQTKATLDQLSKGTGVLSDHLEKLSWFANARRNLWFSQMIMEHNYSVKISGFTYSRQAIKTLSDSYPGALLSSIVYEPLRDTRTFKFNINTDKSSRKIIPSGEGK